MTCAPIDDAPLIFYSINFSVRSLNDPFASVVSKKNLLNISRGSLDIDVQNPMQAFIRSSMEDTFSFPQN